MKKILLLMMMSLVLVACQRYETVEDYIEEIQTELDAVGSVDIEVAYQESDSAIVMIIHDERYRQNYLAYIAEDPQVMEAMEISIENYRKISEGIADILPEQDVVYQLWVRDHTGQDLLKFKGGQFIYQYKN